MRIAGGRQHYGEAIGILLFDDRAYPMAPGDVGNASSYNFPVRIKVVKGLTWYPGHQRTWGASWPPEVDLMVSAAKDLQREGVRAIVTGCGFFATMQDVLADELDIPVFTSPLVLLPMLLRMISSRKSIGVLTASKPHLTEDFFQAGGVDDMRRIQVIGAETASEFTETHMGGERIDMDVDLLERQIVDIAGSFADDHEDLGMLVLECTTFPTFAKPIQERTGLPVVDYISFIEFIYRSVVCRRYSGFV